MPGSRGDAHVVIKCKVGMGRASHWCAGRRAADRGVHRLQMCERTGNVKILSSADTVEYADDSAGRFGAASCTWSV